MTASTMLPSTQLALLQEKIMVRRDYTPAEAQVHMDHLRQFDDLLKYTRNSNLHVRQAFIKAALRYICRVGVPSEDCAEAYALFEPLGRKGYWLEGPSYLDYVGMAVMWHFRVTGLPSSAKSALADMQFNYLEIIAPDGNIPVPEAANGWGGAGDRRGLPDVCNDKYIKMEWRWEGGGGLHHTYLLIDIGTECDPLNLHDHLSTGYYALMIDGLWHHRCRSYTGFNWSDVPTDTGLDRLLPPGALRPLWRLKPPRVSVVRGDASVTVTWRYPWALPVTRRITWANGVLRVVDKWGIFGKRVNEWRVG